MGVRLAYNWSLDRGRCGFVALTVLLSLLGVLLNWWLVELPAGFRMGEPSPRTYKVRLGSVKAEGLSDGFLNSLSVLKTDPGQVLSQKLVGLISSFDSNTRDRLLSAAVAAGDLILRDGGLGRTAEGSLRIDDEIWRALDSLSLPQAQKNVVFQILWELFMASQRRDSAGGVIVYEGQTVTEDIARLLAAEGYRDKDFPWKRFLWAVFAVAFWANMSWSLFSDVGNGRSSLGLSQWGFVVTVIFLCWGLQLMVSSWLVDLMFPAAVASWLFLALPPGPAFGLSVGWGMVGAIICFVYFPPLAAIQIVQAVLSAGLGYSLLRGLSSRLSLLFRLAYYFVLISLASMFVRWGFGFPVATAALVQYGALCLLWPSVVLALLPLWERIFGVLSPLMIMELSHPSSPLLKRLQLEAPGTYHHSLAVGAMAGGAAELLGMDGLMVRAGAYYHDIGKLRRPKFFIENQTGGENVHDNLSPSLSALVILSHVRDGLELAEEYGLPGFVRDFISEHHGTTCLAYFYRKARTMGEDVPIDQFSYPGPPPRSRETALVMLADSVEAAAKAMEHRLQDPSEVEGLVDEVIRSKVESKQLDNVDFTMREMRIIRDSFIGALRSMRHTRQVRPIQGSS
ncbi:MAG: HDIG domain-containing protein [Thermanaerothrix sp.]|nr:HDIG domain-containing protein [Thermanaerothrix sp.]